MSRSGVVLALPLLVFSLGCESDHDRALAAMEAGRMAIEAGRAADAIPELERALSLEPGARAALVLLARAEAETDDPAGAIAALDRAAALGPATADELEARGRAELSLEHWELAEVALGQALEADPTRTALLSPRAEALVRLDRRDDAIEAYRGAAIADEAAAAPRIALARLFLDVEAETGTSRACPGLEPGPGGALAAPPLDREGVPDGDAPERCLSAEGSPCAPRITARQILVRARELVREAAPREEIDALLARATALDGARAARCTSEASARLAALDEARGGGAIGALAALTGAWNAPTSPFGSGTALGDDPTPSFGALMGDGVPPSYGEGGLGLRGGGGTAGGVAGLGSIGTLGHGAGTGSGTSFGSGGLGSRDPSPGSVQLGAATVGPGLAPEVVRRVVRRHINEVRYCYELALTATPAVTGRLTIAFTIDATGAVTEAHVATDTIGDAALSTCVTTAHRRWSFPAPDPAGTVTVTMPYLLELAE